MIEEDSIIPATLSLVDDIEGRVRVHGAGHP
jgi:hypothetical protein